MIKTGGGSDLVKSLVIFSCQLVFLELLWKIQNKEDTFWLLGCFIVSIIYVLCVFSEFCGLKDNFIVKTNIFKSILTVMHGLDGFAALLIGIGMKTKNILLYVTGLLIITKCCLIHLMNRMILAHKKPEVHTFLDGFTQTSKSFLHHVASFLFLSQPAEIVLTTAWRTISMSGHAILVLRGGRVSPNTLSRISSILGYIRNAFVFCLLCLCLFDPNIRDQFARSAVGHIAYMMVRIGPVFQQGGASLSAVDKEEWTALSSRERLNLLLTGRHLMLGVELALLSILTSYFAVLRARVLVCDVIQWQYNTVNANKLYNESSGSEATGYLSVLSAAMRTSLESLREAHW